MVGTQFTRSWWLMDSIMAALSVIQLVGGGFCGLRFRSSASHWDCPELRVQASDTEGISRRTDDLLQQRELTVSKSVTSPAHPCSRPHIWRRDVSSDRENEAVVGQSRCSST